MRALPASDSSEKSSTLTAITETKNLSNSPNLRLIEIGCGVGNTIFPLLDAYPTIKVAATDFSPRAVNFVLERHAQDPEKYKNLETAFVSDLSKDHVFESIQNLLTPENARISENLHQKFNLVTLIFCLSAISPEKFQICFQNLKFLLQPGQKSKIFFRDYAINDHAMIRFKKGKNISERLYMRQDVTRSYFFTREEVIKLVESVGGTVLNLEYIFRKTINKAEKVDVDRVFLQGCFEF